MRFYGNEICCGSYACLNAMQDPSIDLQLFEISTSTPFGIRHFEMSISIGCSRHTAIRTRGWTVLCAYGDIM